MTPSLAATITGLDDVNESNAIYTGGATGLLEGVTIRRWRWTQPVSEGDTLVVLRAADKQVCTVRMPILLNGGTFTLRLTITASDGASAYVEKTVTMTCVPFSDIETVTPSYVSPTPESPSYTELEEPVMACAIVPPLS